MPDVIQIAIQATDLASKVIGGVGDSLDKVAKQSDEADKKLKLFGLTTEQIGSKMSTVGKIATVGLTLPIAGIATAAVKSASDLNETMSKIDVLFENSADTIKGWADTAATSLGQSKKQALDAAADFATFGKAAGLAGNDLVDFSKKNVQLAADFASFFNTSPEEAITAIGAAFRGESEPIRRYGVLINEASLKDQALRMGLIKTTTEALQPQQRVLAAQALIMQQTTAAQGDFARTSSGLANQQRILNAQFQDTIAALGQSLLPTVIKVATAANDLLTAFNNLDQPTKDLIVGFGLMAAAAGPVMTIGGKLISVFTTLGSVSIDVGSRMLTMSKSVIDVAGTLQRVGVTSYTVRDALLRLKDTGALLTAELGIIVAGLIAIGKYLGEVDAASKATTEDLLKMANSGDVFKQAAASTEILVNGQNRLKAALDATHAKIRTGAKDYADYRASIEATTKAAGYEINSSGDLVEVTAGLTGRVEKLVQANYALSESGYKADQVSHTQAYGVDLLSSSMLRASGAAQDSAQAQVKSTQEQMTALREYYTAMRDANAEGLVRANEQAAQSIEVLKIAMAGAVGKEMESFRAKQDELQTKAAELQTAISTSYGRARDDAIKSLGEINQQLLGNAQAHEEATKRILFDIAAQQLATVQDPQIRAKAMNELALQWDLVDKDTYEATENIIQATSKLAADNNVNAFKANLESIANKQLGTTPIDIPVEPKVNLEAVKAQPLPALEVPVTPKIDREAARLTEKLKEPITVPIKPITVPVSPIEVPIVPKIDREAARLAAKLEEPITVPVKPKIETDTKGAKAAADALKGIPAPVITPKIDSAQATKDIQTFTAGSVASIPKEIKTTAKADTEKATTNTNNLLRLYGTIPLEKNTTVNVDGSQALQTINDIITEMAKIVSKTVTIKVKYETQGEPPAGLQHGGSFVVPPNPFGGSGDYFPVLAAPGERVTVQTKAQQSEGRYQPQTSGGDTYNYTTNIFNPLAAVMWADQQRRERIARSNARMGVT